MQFVSTRGGMQPASFSDILLEGLAPDGGLVMPQEIPQVSSDRLEAWRDLAYAELATEVIGQFWTDIPRDDLAAICARAYGSQFAAEVPVTALDERVALVGLSEGPTLAFKDMAMQFPGEAIPYVLEQRGETLNILGATSGDTGSAAEYAFRSKPHIAVFMLSPKGRMSAFQRAQMYSLDDANIHNIVVDGVFDDCQNLVKALNGDLEFKAANTLGTVNSINLGRVAAQIVYYFWAWLRATDARPGSTAQVSFSVPSGNFGNLCSGLVAKRMGVPISRLVLATNENNVLDEFFRTGVYTPRSRAETLVTSSPSMDISKASNLERFVYLLLGSDPERLSAAWTELDATGRLDLSAELRRFAPEFGIVGGMSTHADRLEVIREAYEGTGTVVDPHTADGLKVAREYLEPGVSMLVLETAKPQKFAETVREAIGRDPEVSAELADLLERPQRVVEMSDDADQLREYIREHAVRG
jgi:threonine synthase